MGARPSSFAKSDTPVVPVVERVWSDQQQAIFTWFKAEPIRWFDAARVDIADVARFYAGEMIPISGGGDPLTAIGQITRNPNLVVRARAGCLAGETTIDVHRAGRSFSIAIDQLVHKQNNMGPKANRSRWGGACWDENITTQIRARDANGCVQLFDLTAAVDSGLKETYTVCLEDGRNIRATAAHPFLTTTGWKTLRELREGSMVFVDGGRDNAVTADKPRYRVVKVNGYREPEHRVVVEADMNGLSVERYIAERRAGLKPLIRLGERQIVHHRNQNHLDNQLSNLQVMEDSTEHARHHGHKSAWKHLTAIVMPVAVLSITENRLEPTYDLTVDGPANFLANGIVVHNTGKTTTICEGVNRAPEDAIWVCAFGKQTQKVLQATITNPNAESTTVHSMGLRFIRRRWRNMPMEPVRHRRAESLTNMVCDQSVPKPIRQLISKLHTKGREMHPLDATLERLMYLAEFFDLVPDEAYVDYDTRFIADHALMAMAIAASDAPHKDVGIDFADMVYLPLVWDLITPDFQMVVVDEAQDLSIAQLTFAQRICSGRICIVGDDRQAIYGFRGADTGSLDRLKAELGAVELPLTVTYRCAQAVVRLAQTLVPDIQAAPGNPEGVVDACDYHDLLADVLPTDFVLSRLNAPLVVITLRLLMQGQRARMEGRDIGAGILAVLNRLKVPTSASVGLMVQKLDAWERKSVASYLAQGLIDLADRTRDQAAMLRAFSERAESMTDLRNRIEWLFQDTGDDGTDVPQVVCSSIHKIKGLESEHVWVLKESLYRRGPSQEEDNLFYVATTRAKTHLTWVTGVPRLA